LLLVLTALLMAWTAGSSLAEQFSVARASVTEMFPFLRRVGKTYQGFVKALAQNGAFLLERLGVHLRLHVQQMESCWRVGGHPAFAVDGSRVECPRTKANEKELKRAGRKKTGPQLSLTTIYHMGSGCPWDYRIGPGIQSERTHLRDMLATLPPEALLVADAGFSGYDLLQSILQSKRHVLFRVGRNVTLLRNLGYFRIENDSTVYLWPEKAQREHQAPVVLRLIVLPGRHPVHLVTDLSEEKLSYEQASLLYRMRWGVEVFYRSLKQTLGHRKMRSHAPRQAKMELHWAMAGLWVLSLLTAKAIVARGKNPQSLSIALARKQVRLAMAGQIRPGTDLTRKLALTQKDSYVRAESKMARDWPHKKNDPPAGQPKIKYACPRQVQLAKELRERITAA